MATVLDATQDAEVLLALFRSEERDRIRLVQDVQRNGYLAVKAVLEYSLAVVILILAAPVILLCAVLVRLTSRGPAFYSQTRLGLGGRPYRIYKLRTMYHQCELLSGPQWSQSGDPRVTPLGRFLRSTHLDELPQLWNILRGEMGLIGPRPERPEFIPALAKAIPLYEMRMLVRPGVTGLAQVQVPADSDLESVRVKVAHDLFYIQNASLWMDLRILAATLFKVFGVSFSSLRQRFRMPAPGVIEDTYQELQSDIAPAPEQPEVRPALISAQ
jgi:lipopolysaccharide/colanic/teichoic acid biosynthesis glycosyltransferase